MSAGLPAMLFSGFSVLNSLVEAWGAKASKRGTRDVLQISSEADNASPVAACTGRAGTPAGPKGLPYLGTNQNRIQYNFKKPANI